MSGETAAADRIVRAKRRLLRMHYEAGVGHIGGNLSCLDLLVMLFQECIFDEDQFVLSKGHAAGALYVALWATDRLAEGELASFHRDGTRLAGHPVSGWHADIVFATGSLGHGLSLAAGVAHGRRLKGTPGTIYCLVSDGELNEGSTWEALHYAAHHRLANLVTIVDQNGLQGFGTTRETLDLGELSVRLEHLGFAAVTIDGHSPEAIQRALTTSRTEPARPTVVIARTVKGHGISFMENRMEWHYLPLSEALYAQGLRELGSVTEAAPTPDELDQPPAVDRPTGLRHA